MNKLEQNRWAINKLGLVNYWWYDEEEFKFLDGRLILRGTNGSGKSVTMQSFIPLLLDGNKAPERLDPFNTRARKIEDYVLGYGEDIKEENTSYLYMEFCKKETQNYITVGMGLRGKKGQGVDFWGFIIKDGRRIGKDIFVYKNLGNKIPLTKQELKNLIGEGGEVVNSAKEYAKLVNSNIFGFETLEEYEEFIKLLIEIRTPKLSKDGFKPSVITEIMSNALRPLLEEDLRPVSESIENMNKTKEQLEILKTSKRAIENITIHYDNYNKCVLYNKAKKYINIDRVYRKTLKEEKEISEKLENTKLEHIHTLKNLEEVNKNINVYEYKRKELEKNELWQQKEQMVEMEKRVEQITTDLGLKTTNEEEKNLNIIRKESSLKENKNKYEIEEKHFEETEEELKAIAGNIEYDEYFFKIDEIKEDINKKYNYTSFTEDIKRYITKIEQGKNVLEKEQLVSKEYEMALENLDGKKNEKLKQDGIVNKARQELEVKKENFIEEMYKWEKANTFLKLESADMASISTKVQNYGENVGYDDIIKLLRTPYEKKRIEFTENIAKLSVNKQEVKEKINENILKIKEWKNTKEPEPAKSKRIFENRENLKTEGIPFIELYNAIDFKENVSNEQKGKIEAALLDMGVLDSLIIPKEYRKKVELLDNNFVDKYLFAGGPSSKNNLLELLKITLPQNSKIDANEVSEILKSIAIDDQNANTYLNKEGIYKIGIIKGNSSKDENAKYIGSETRKQYKELLIKELEQEIVNLEVEQEKVQANILELENKKLEVEQEYNKFPQKDEIENTYNNLRKEINIINSIKEQIFKLEEIQTEKFEKLKLAKEETKNVTAKLRFTVTLETYAEKLESANEFKEKLFGLEKHHNEIVNLYIANETISQDIEDLKADLDNILYEKNKMLIEKKELEAKINTIKQMASSNITELEQQMDECIRMLKELPKNKEILIENKGKLESKIETISEETLNINERINILSQKNKIVQDILVQELCLKYVIEEYEEINKIANKIILNYAHFEKDSRDVASYYRTLVEKYRENNESLTDYNLSISDIFVEEIREKNVELAELIKTKTRSDIICFVKGKKVNLYALKKDVEETIEEMQGLVDAEDRHLFEEILIGAVGRKIRERIYHAKSWVDSMNKLMESLNTSSGLSFSLKWKPKQAIDETEIDTKEIIDILNSDSGLLRQDEIEKVAMHFRSKFAKAEEKLKEKDNIAQFHIIMKEVLDYRNWFEFQFMHKKAGEQSKELTNNAFYKLSGGEKAMAMYVPLFASVYARYESAKKDSPRIISLDEAFAGVDDNNIRDMFRILTELELEYVINSQVLWGEYDTVPSLAICELISDANSKIVSAIRYKWNGVKRELII